MKKALVWCLQTAQKSHSENANEVHIVNYHWARPPPCQGAGSQSLSRWVCWPSHHKPWVNTREFTGAHKAGDDKSLGLCDAERKRDLYILFSPHGATHCPCYTSSMGYQCTRLKSSSTDPGATSRPTISWLSHDQHMGMAGSWPCSTTQIQLHVARCQETLIIQMAGSQYMALTEYLWLPTHFVSMNATSVTRRQINICPHYTGRNWDTERLHDLFYAAKVNSRARKMMSGKQSPNFLHTPWFSCAPGCDRLQYICTGSYGEKVQNTELGLGIHTGNKSIQLCDGKL